jgi:hypothetical protein
MKLFHIGTSIEYLALTTQESDMKKTVFILLVLFIGANSASAFSRYNEGFTMFYSSLEPFGEWIEIDYNLYAWQPYNTAYSWRPYSNGRWEWTRHGWYWVSYEPFGWATYHYGRWFYDDYYGWLWIPDTEWGPSWVEWRYNNSYIGWAPLPPYARFHRNSGIHFTISWNSGYYHWNFVNYHHFHGDRIHVHIVNNYRSYNIFNNTKYRTNYYSRNGRIVNGGVNRKFVERRGGYKIKERKIEITSDVQTYRTRNNDNSRNSLISYKPRISDSERNVQVNKEKIRKADVNSSLKKDRIFINETDVREKTIQIDERKSLRESVVKKESAVRSGEDKIISKRTESYNRENKEQPREVSSRSKTAETKSRNVNVNKNGDVKRSTDYESKKRLTKTKSESRTKSIEKNNTVKKKRNTGIKKETAKLAENDSKKKRLTR